MEGRVFFHGSNVKRNVFSHFGEDLKSNFSHFTSPQAGAKPARQLLTNFSEAYAQTLRRNFSGGMTHTFIWVFP